MPSEIFPTYSGSIRYLDERKRASNSESSLRAALESQNGEAK
jgi:hypothetical protein